MLLKENITMAINSIISNKMRSLLTMLGIIIGIAAVIAIFTVGDSLSQSVTSSLQEMGSSDIFVSVDERDTGSRESQLIDGVVYDDARAEAEMSDSDYITTEMLSGLLERYGDDIYAINVSESAGSGTASKAGKEASISVTGTSVGYFVTEPMDIVAGSMFSADDFTNGRQVALVNKSLATDLFGDDPTDAVGETIEILIDNKLANVTITGVYDTSSSGTTSMSSMMSYFFGSTTVYMPLKAVTIFTNRSGLYSNLRISAAYGADTKVLCNEIEDYFSSYYRNNPDFEVSAYTYDSMVDMLDSLLGTVTTAISLVAGIALIVGGIGVMNIMLVSVTERTREIGTRKALGAKNSSIRAQFIVEAMILCLIGGIIGLILGIVGGTAASNYMGYPATPSLKGILISIGFSMAIGLFFGYFPANKAAKMNPIDALRYE